ncbi:MAG: cytochrome c5 family protein [Gammaproteobacteria bacterium]|nr:cytochrome c5 family protein [Gammaproteobacteria bacterium]
MRTMIIVILGLVVLFVVIVIAARVVASGPSVSIDPTVVSKIEQQIEPVGKVELAGAAPAPAAGGKVDGQAVYQGTCFACHGTGAAGAPKIGDKAAWKARIAEGATTLYEHALKGFKGMPPKGGNTALADDAVKAAVDYLMAQGK